LDYEHQSITYLTIISYLGDKLPIFSISPLYKEICLHGCIISRDFSETHTAQLASFLEKF